MRTPVLVDAGPLIAFLNECDAGNHAAVEGFKSLRGAAVTTWPVIAEAAYMLGKASLQAQLDLLGLVADGTLTLAELGPGDAARAAQLMEKYGDRRMDFADASLLLVAEREKIKTILTFDKADFKVYRAAGIGALKVLP